MAASLPGVANSSHRLGVLWPLALFALALALRSFGLNFELSFDELWFLELSAGHGSTHMTLPRNQLIESAPAVTSLDHAPPIWTIPGSLELVSHPPIYPMLLRIWRSAVGESPLASRWFSVIASALCAPLLFDSVRLLNGRRVAFWAGLLLALSSTQITYAQEIRNYPLAELLLLATINALIRLEVFGVGLVRGAALFCFAAATIFTHYFALPAVAALGLYGLIRMRGRPRRVVACTLIVAAGLLALWLPMLLAQQRAIRAQLAYWPLPDEGVWWRLVKIRELILCPMRLLFESSDRMRVFSLSSGVLLLILPWLCLKRQPRLLLWLLLMQSVLITIFLYDFVCKTNQMLEVRHEIIAAIGLCAIIPILSRRLPGWLATATPALIALACVPSITLRHEPNFEHFSGLARIAADPRYRNEPIVFFGKDPFLWWSDVMFLGVSSYSGTFPRSIIRADRPLDDSLLAELKRWPGAVLIYESGNGPPERIVPGSATEAIGAEPFLAQVAHLTWNQPSTQPAATSAGHERPHV